MRSVHRFSPARVRTLIPVSDPSRTRKLTRIGTVLMFAGATVTSCSESAIPTSPGAMSVPEAGAASTSAERRTAPATLAWEATARALVTRFGTSPINAARVYALLGVAQYAAAVAADDANGVLVNVAAVGDDEGGRAHYEARRGAIGAASKGILSILYPTAASELALQLEREGVADNGRTHPHFTRGIAIGKVVGGTMAARAATDGFSKPWDGVRYLEGSPGVWFQHVPIPPATAFSPPAGHQFPTMRPYFLESAAQFREPPPFAFGSPEFNDAVAHVRRIADTRTEAQQRSAEFWNLNIGTVTAPGYWGEQAATFIAARGLGDRDAAHVYALTNAAALDAAIGCWDAKYRYLVPRPTQADPGILKRPPFPYLGLALPNHPSYPSGHSCVSAAAATVLSAFFPERAAELQADVEAAGMSRVYAGIHYMFDVTAGQTLGRNVGMWALQYDRQHGLLATLDRP